MSRGTLVYILMFIALVGGMWVILPLGEGLVAPFNLAGRWEIEPDLSMGPRVGPPLGRTMEVEQSGRYFQVRFASGRTLDLKLMRESRHDARVKMELAGGGWDMTCDANAAGGTMHIDLRGAVTRAWTAKRVNPGSRDTTREEELSPQVPAARATSRPGPAGESDDTPGPVGPALPDPLGPATTAAAPSTTAATSADAP